MDSIYTLKLHEKTILENDGTEVRRVPGGWIYTRLELSQLLRPDGYWTENYIPTSVFVPLDDGFMRS